jgi:hypothetical protein
LSTITFNLIMFGLYMAWTGMQGASVLGSAGITLTSLLGGFGKGLLGGLGKAVPEAAPVEAYVPDALNGALDEALNLFDASENVAAPIGQRMLDGVAEASSSAITNAQALEEIFANQAAVGPEVGTAVALGELAATQGTMSALNDMFELQASEGFEEAMVPLAVLKDGIDVAPKSNKFPLKKAALVLGGTAAAGLAAYGIYKMLKKRQANKTEAPEAPTSYTVIDRNDLEANGCGML